jgi:hypothetical protein
VAWNPLILVCGTSPLTTFDALRNYADLPIKSIEEIANDEFTWSPKETEVGILLYSAPILITDHYFKENNESRQ